MQFARNKEEETSRTLFSACISGDVETIRSLIDAGADVNARDLCGKTALELVIDSVLRDPLLEKNREEILDLFREYAPEAVMEVYCSPGPA